MRTLPILSENFSAQTSSTGRRMSCISRTASPMPYGKPAQAATRSNEAWVWKIPSCPESHVAIEGSSRVLVQEQKMTAPISSGRPPGALERRIAAPISASSSRS